MKFKFDLKKIEAFLKEQKQKVAEKLENLTPEQIGKLKKGLILGGSTFAIIMIGVAVSSIPHKENPVSEELLVEAMVQEKAPEPEVEEEPEEEAEEVKECEEGCTLEPGHEGACVVKKEDVQVVLKTTSMERDLKVKFVNQKTGKVITGAKFQMKLTDSAKKVSEYSDTDADGIIWVKDIEGGNYTVEMLELEGYVTAKTLSAEVKKKIEYKVVEVAEEVKSESEIVVSQEDAEFSGTNQDESTSDTTVLKDTVEYVESKKEEKTVTTTTQKVDSFQQKVYEKQAVDVLGQPMYARIKSESSNFHVDKNSDGKCDRCGASMVTCTAHTDKNNDQKCDNCGEKVSADLHQHYDTDNDGKCDGCNAEVKHTHTDENKDCRCDGCGEQLAHTDTNGDCKCDVCETEYHPDNDGDGNCDNKNCVKNQPSEPEEPEDAGASGADPDAGASDQKETGTDPEAQDVSTGTEAAFRLKQTMGLQGLMLRQIRFVGAAAEKQFIEYDTTSAPIYDTTSAPVYETKTETVYYGWQTIDGATYYFDKNGNKVTGQQVIQGVSYTFSSEGVRSGTIGIDVSKYQKNIDWTKIKNAGINFAIIRCGYRGYGSGVLVEDPMFASHIKGAKAAGLRVGIYFFSQAINEAEAVEEASMAVSLAKKYGINMPIAIDSEYANGGKGRADGLSKSDRTTVTKAFCNTVKNAGYTPMVYASKSWFGSHLDVSQLSAYRIWVAHYADKCGYTGRYDIWQNTSKGKVDGYSGYLDMNVSSI